MSTATTKPTAPLPEPNGDFYQVTETLNDSERAILRKVRAYMESKVVFNQLSHGADRRFKIHISKFISVTLPLKNNKFYY